MRLPVPFAGGSTPAQSVVIDNQEAINWYPSKEDPGAKAPVTMKPTPGLKYLFDAGLGPARSNGIEFMEKLYFISNNKLVEINADMTAGTEVGTLNTSEGRCSMAASPTELLIVDGTDGYLWDGTTFSVISDPDFPAATHVTWLDFYFIANDAGTGQFYISNLNDGSAWDALDFATAESSPDDLLAVYATLNELWLFGEKTTEVYYNSGNVDFPFEQIPHGVMNIGIQAPHSIAENEAGELTWLSASRQGGYDVVAAKLGGFRVLNDAANGWYLSDISTSSDAYAWIYTQAAHTFYVLTLPTEDATMVYDYREQFWHRRRAYGKGRHRAAGHAFFNGKHIVGDYLLSSFYELDLETYDDNGAVIERIRRGQIVHKDRLNLFLSRMEIEFEPGVGLVSGQGSDPQAMLRYTRNGKIWSSELWRSIGKIGEYDARCVWGPLGDGRQFQFEIKITDPVKPILVGAYIDLEVGTS